MLPLGSYRISHNVEDQKRDIVKYKYLYSRICTRNTHMTLKPEQIDEGFKVLGLFETSEREKILIQNQISYQIDKNQKSYKIEEKISASNW